MILGRVSGSDRSVVLYSNHASEDGRRMGGYGKHCKDETAGNGNSGKGEGTEDTEA